MLARVDVRQPPVRIDPDIARRIDRVDISLDLQTLNYVSLIVGDRKIRALPGYAIAPVI